MSAPATSDQLLQQGLFHHRQGQLAQAMERYTDVLRTDPQNADALYYVAVVACQEGQFRQGVDLARRALEHGPPQARVHNLLGKAYEQLGDSLEAVKAYDQAIATDAGFAEAHGNRAALLAKSGFPEQALESFDRALALNPKALPDLINLGALQQVLGRHEEALATYDRAMALAPNDTTLLMNRAASLFKLGRLDDAEAIFEKLIQLNPRFLPAQVQKGLLLNKRKRHGEAIICLDATLAIEPDDATALSGKARALYRLGRVDQARALLEKVIARQPNDPRPYLELSEMKRFADGDPEIAAMENLLPQLEPGRPDDLIEVTFALAKAYDDVGRKAESFRHLARANSLRRGQFHYDEAAVIDNFKRTAEVFTPELLRSRAGSGDPSDKPVFIVGMPRSGTTLIEQILASHPQVHGAGELTDFRETMTTVARSQAYPELVPGLTPEQIGEIGATYLARITAAAPAAARITDKMPSNFALVGLIRLALPNARIIHVRRDPRDNCYSCFATDFGPWWRFCYELGELGRFYRAYERLMDHWRQLLPDGAMLEVQYEDVVADLETQARRLVAYCGLDWDESCLSFHATSRPVYTASAAQVRRPLYGHAVGRWRAYADELRPLLDALERPG